MTLLSMSKMVFFPTGEWEAIEKAPPAPLPFALLVLVLSVLPPIMLYHAGSSYGDAFVAGYGAKPWGLIAAAFYLTEVATLSGMAWFIRQIAASQGVVMSLRNAAMLAAIAPIPLWLSSLGLLVPSLAFNGLLALAALVAALALIYHGIYALCHLHDEVLAAGITLTVMGAGLVAWAMLLLVVVAVG